MLAAIFRIVALVRKELLAMLKDPRGRAVLFVPPVLQCIVFGYVVNYDLTRVAYIAFDRDRSAASSELLASLDGSGVFQRVANLERAADVKTMIDERRALVAVQIDQDFERRLLSGRSAAVQVIADGRNSNTAGTALNYVRTVVDSFNAKWWAAHGGGVYLGHRRAAVDAERSLRHGPRVIPTVRGAVAGRGARRPGRGAGRGGRRGLRRRRRRDPRRWRGSPASRRATWARWVH